MALRVIINNKSIFAHEVLNMSDVYGSSDDMGNLLKFSVKTFNNTYVITNDKLEGYLDFKNTIDKFADICKNCKIKTINL